SNEGDVKRGKDHFRAVFSTLFNKDQLAKIDPDGVVLPGQKVQPGDPLILATTPRTLSSKAGLGRLSRAMSTIRQDASNLWDGQTEGIVTGVAKTPKGVKVTVRAVETTEESDKIVFRNGQKNVVAKIIDDERMPRLKDGTPLEVLLNPLGLPSRVNNNMVYELLLGKIAHARGGAPYKLPAFLPKGQRWQDFVRNELKKANIPEEEEVYDPELNRVLEQPITVGRAYMLKLHHTGKSKTSMRNQGSYDLNQQPAKGGWESAQAKRVSGLEVNGLRSAGAYNVIRENSTLRGQRNDEYWRALRAGRTPVDPGRPFVFDKFIAMLGGAGIRVADKGKGVLRLGPFTDKHLD
ncbi:hypothetical protein EB061_13320, partial [bacterium]|nr:hypothetical protein [bacterium]